MAHTVGRKSRIKAPISNSILRTTPLSISNYYPCSLHLSLLWQRNSIINVYFLVVEIVEIVEVVEIVETVVVVNGER